MNLTLYVCIICYSLNHSRVFNHIGIFTYEEVVFSLFTFKGMHSTPGYTEKIKIVTLNCW